MSNKDDVGAATITTVGVYAQISHALASGKGLDALGRAVVAVGANVKVGIFTAVSLAVSDNKVATSLGLLAGTGVTVVVGIVGAPIAAVAALGLVGGAIVGFAVEQTARALGIGSGNKPANNPESPPESKPIAAGVNPHGGEVESGGRPNPHGGEVEAGGRPNPHGGEVEAGGRPNPHGGEVEAGGRPNPHGGEVEAGGRPDPHGGEVESGGRPNPHGGEVESGGRPDPHGGEVESGGRPDPHGGEVESGGRPNPHGGEVESGGRPDPHGGEVESGGRPDPHGGEVESGGRPDPHGGEVESGGRPNPHGGEVEAGGRPNPHGGETESGGGPDPHGGETESGGGPDPHGGEGGDGGGKPVLLDLDGDGVELVALEDSTAFYDIHGDGFRYHLSWVAPDDGLLAYDRDGDGWISERGEISFVDYVEGARTDLEGLRHFDTNGDNVLDSADGEWRKFKVWQDLDQDGESDPGELRSLDEAGIRSISLVSSGRVETRSDGTRILGHGTYVGTDGGAPVTRELLDVALQVAPWGYRATTGGAEVRWKQGEGVADGFMATSDEPVTLDVAANDYRSAMGGAGDDRLTNTGVRTVMLAGLAGDDVLRGGTAGDLLLGGDGDDELYGGAGTDILDGGLGADRIEGGAGDDLVHGGAGGDTLDGGANRDIVSYETSDAGVTVDLRDGNADGFHDMASGGHAGGDSIRNFEDVVGSAHDDVLTGHDGANRLEGGEGRDELHGGAGDDVLVAGSNVTGGWQELYGEAGSDTYRIGRADGQVRIGAAAEGASRRDTDTVEFTDLSLADMEFTFHDYTAGGTVDSPEGLALVVRWTKDGQSGELRIAQMGRRIEKFVFADGSTLGRIEADWLARRSAQHFAGRADDKLTGTSEDDVMASGSGAERLEGGRGNDRLDAGGGEDTVVGDWGADTLHGGDGNDTLFGGTGADVLDGGVGDDWMTGGDGADELRGGAGRDTVHGGAGDDVLSAGSNEAGGWQQLEGGAGDDTYRYARGDGSVRIDTYAESADTGAADRVEFTDLALSEVEFSYETYWAYDYEDGVSVASERQALVIRWAQDGESGGLWIADRGGHIERFEFADGSTLGRVDADLSSREPQQYAGHPDDRLEGTAGADVMRGGAGRDWLDGRAGHDKLLGGHGDDVYTFSGREFGRDTVRDLGGADRIEFTGGLRPDELRFTRSGRDLVIAPVGTKSEVTVKRWWGGPFRWDVDRSRHIEAIQVGGRTLTSSTVSQLVQAMAWMKNSSFDGTTTRPAMVQRQRAEAPLAAWQEIAGP